MDTTFEEEPIDVRRLRSRVVHAVGRCPLVRLRPKHEPSRSYLLFLFGQFSPPAFSYVLDSPDSSVVFHSLGQNSLRPPGYEGDEAVRKGW